MGFKRRYATGSTAQIAHATDNMDIHAFWHIIELAGLRARAGDTNRNHERFASALRELLRPLGPEAVVAFSCHFDERMRESYRHDLWDAAYLIDQGCGDDGFQDFRAWLISMGREVYERALHDPDSLVEPLRRPEVGYWYFEGLPALPVFLYEEMTGCAFPDSLWRPYPAQPHGTAYDGDNRQLSRRFPALWADFGKYWDSSE